MLANESMQIFTYLANKIKYDKNVKNNVQSMQYIVPTIHYVSNCMYSTLTKKIFHKLNDGR